MPVAVCSVFPLLNPFCIPYDGKVILAKTNYSFEKRQRELEKKRKAEEKARRKAEAKHTPGGAGDEPAEGGEAGVEADADTDTQETQS